MSRAIDERRGWHTCLLELGWLAYQQGDYTRAATLLREGVAIGEPLHGDLLDAIELLAPVLARQGHAGQATRLWGALEASRASLNIELDSEFIMKRDPDAMAVARTALGETVFLANWQAGAEPGRNLTRSTQWNVARAGLSPYSVHHGALPIRRRQTTLWPPVSMMVRIGWCATEASS